MTKSTPSRVLRRKTAASAPPRPLAGLPRLASEQARIEAGLEAQVGGLLEKLVKAHDINSSVFRDTITALDAGVSAMSRVLDDFVCGREVKTIEFEGARHVDYNAYLQSAPQGQDGPVKESSLVAVGDDEVRVFGGSI